MLYKNPRAPWWQRWGYAVFVCVLIGVVIALMVRVASEDGEPVPAPFETPTFTE